MWVFAPGVYSPLGSVLEAQGAWGEEALRLFSRYWGPFSITSLIYIYNAYLCPQELH